MRSLLIKDLMDFGLSDGEAKVYLALLELGVATINEIARKAGTNRSSTYVLVSSLEKRRFVNKCGNDSIQKYLATAPEALLHSAEEKVNHFDCIRKKVKKIVPELKSLHKDTKCRPRVSVFEGYESIKENYRRILIDQISKGMRQFRVYEDLLNFCKFLPPGCLKTNFTSSETSKIEMNLISTDKAEAMLSVGGYKNADFKGKFVFVPECKFRSSKCSSLGVSICHDKVKFISSKESFMIVIENQEIADTLKDIFDLAWERYKNLEKNDKKPIKKSGEKILRKAKVPKKLEK